MPVFRARERARAWLLAEPVYADGENFPVAAYFLPLAAVNPDVNVAWWVILR